MPIVLGRRYDTGEPCSITIKNDRIVDVTPVWPSGPLSDWPYVAPGLFDLQINGHSGIWYSHAGLTRDQVLLTLQAYFAYGVTRLYPTLITTSYEAFAAGFAALRQACDEHRWADNMVPGFHMEGPYLCGEDGPRGAHPLEHIRPADWNEFSRLQEIAGGRIRLVTLSPESDVAIDFIKRAVATGITIAIGHTAATRDQIQAAVDAGATLSTHLGNGAHGMMRRHPNCIWEQLGEPRLYASIITDGHHLPATVVNSIVRAKTPYRTILTLRAVARRQDRGGRSAATPGRIEPGYLHLCGERHSHDGLLIARRHRHGLAVSGASAESPAVPPATRLAGRSVPVPPAGGGFTTGRGGHIRRRRVKVRRSPSIEHGIAGLCRELCLVKMKDVAVLSKVRRHPMIRWQLRTWLRRGHPQSRAPFATISDRNYTPCGPSSPLQSGRRSPD